MEKPFRLEGRFGDFQVKVEKGGPPGAIANMTMQEIERYRDELVALLAEIERDLRRRHDERES